MESTAGRCGPARELARAELDIGRKRGAALGRRDRVEKLDLYARYAVGEYWIVDPDSQHIEFLINEAGRFVVQSPANDRYQSPSLPEVVIELADFWREVDRQMAD